MTEAEIVKELQSAAEWFAEHGKNTNTAIIGICERAVDLINRKNAEIDRLTAIEESHREQNGELRKEVERLTINMNARGLGMIREKERADTARAEAIKEFLRKVDETFALYGATEDVSAILDQIAKEMGVE